MKYIPGVIPDVMTARHVIAASAMLKRASDHTALLYTSAAASKRQTEPNTSWDHAKILRGSRNWLEDLLILIIEIEHVDIDV